MRFLRERVDAERKRLNTDDLTALATWEDLSSGCSKLLIAFSNVHQLNGTSDNTLRGSRQALLKVGKLLSTLTYFDIDSIDSEQ